MDINQGVIQVAIYHQCHIYIHTYTYTRSSNIGMKNILEELKYQMTIINAILFADDEVIFADS
jgi:hypothetical protein